MQNTQKAISYGKIENSSCLFRSPSSDDLGNCDDWDMSYCS